MGTESAVYSVIDDETTEIECMNDKVGEAFYWESRELPTLHRVRSWKVGKRKLKRVREGDRFYYMIPSDLSDRKALIAALERVEKADQNIRTAESEHRDSAIYPSCSDGETTLPKAKSPDVAQAMLNGLTSQTERELFNPSNSERQSPPHASVMCNNFAIADNIIRSAACEDSDSVIYCIKDDGMTLLHNAESSEMVHTLLNGLTPRTRQQFITHVDRKGQTAAIRALREGQRAVFTAIWEQSDMPTQRQLVQGPSKNYHGESLLIWAGWNGDRKIVRLILDNISYNCYEEAVTAVSEEIGMTVTHVLVLHQMFDLLAEILGPLTLEKRRAALKVEVESTDHTRSYSSYELALIPPKELLPRLLPERKRHPDMNSERVSDQLLNVIHLLANDYSTISPASMILEILDVTVSV